MIIILRRGSVTCGDVIITRYNYMWLSCTEKFSQFQETNDGDYGYHVFIKDVN